MLTLARLREALWYEPETGRFVRRIAPGKRTDLVGTDAGSPQHQGYICITLDGVKYKAHRLAWLYVTGAWPAANIDHVNGDKSNNSFLNLREATKAQNEMNKPRRANNRSGVTGVYWNAAAGKWQAYIKLSGKAKYLGVYADLDEAKAVRTKAERELFGEFAYREAA